MSKQTSIIGHLSIKVGLMLVLLVNIPLMSELAEAESGNEFNEPKIQIDLTPEERAWIAEHPIIRIAGPRSFPPFHYYDERGELKGMSADYIKTVMDALGVTVEIQSDLPWPEVLRRAKAKEIDLISCAAISADREEYLNFSLPYLSFPLVIISAKDAPFIGGLDDLHGKTVALVRGISTEDWLRQDNIKIDTLIVNSPLEALEATSFGKADVSIENLAAASYLIQKNGLTNLKIAAPTPYGSYNLHIAVRKDWPILLEIVNKSLGTITPEAQSLIRNKWLSVRYEHGVRVVDIFKWVFIAVSIAAMIVAIILLWNQRLQKEIAQRKKAEEKREKTIIELKDALDNIKILKGLVPICSNCKKIRDDEGYWNHLESYIEKHSDAQFSHGICDDCASKLYGKQDWYKKLRHNLE